MSDIVLLGAARSGLTVVARSIAEAAGADIRHAAKLSPRLAAAGEGTHRLICAADEAPGIENMLAAPGVLDALPDARAVVVWRSAVDFVNSRLRARPGGGFIDHCLLWVRTRRASRALAEKYSGRVILVEQRRLLVEPHAVAEELRRFLAPMDFVVHSAEKVLRGATPSRSAAFMGAAVDHPARTGWSMSEVEVFLSICGQESHPGEISAILRSAEARRPIDLRQALLERAKAQGLARIEPPESRADSPVLRFPLRQGAFSAPLDALRLVAVSAGGRRLVRLRLRALEGDGEAMCEIVESVSRRPLFVGTLAFSVGTELDVERLLPAHEGLIDLAFTRAPNHGGGSIAIERASLSTA
jgi:hypothetical protein